jgi:hypothetical protein
VGSEENREAHSLRVQPVQYRHALSHRTAAAFHSATSDAITHIAEKAAAKFCANARNGGGEVISGGGDQDQTCRLTLPDRCPYRIVLLTISCRRQNHLTATPHDAGKGGGGGDNNRRCRDWWLCSKPATVAKNCAVISDPHRNRRHPCD